MLRREAALRGEPAPRLLSGPEQDVVIRDLLAGDIADGARDWPHAAAPGAGTRGFAQELRDLIMRAYERGLTPSDLNRLGREHQRDDWRAAARFMRQYAEVTALREAAAYDPAELIRAVVSLWISDPALLARERDARQVVFVDELQDTDPAQIELLRLLAGGGRDLVAVGDPDQSIYGFRGADVSGIERFPETFRTAAGEPTPVVALHTSRRSGAVLLAATRRVAAAAGGAERAPGPAARVPTCRRATCRSRCCAPSRRRRPTSPPGCARRTSSTACPGRRWRCWCARRCARCRCSVAPSAPPVCRSPSRPTEVPLARAARRATAAHAAGLRRSIRTRSARSRPSSCSPRPLGGADVIGLRRLRQELRRAELDCRRRLRRPDRCWSRRSPTRGHCSISTPHAAATRPSGWPACCAPPSTSRPATGASVEDVLWAVWSASGLATRWERASLDGGPAGAAADRDLDAVVALFETAARFCDRLPGAGPEVFLAHLTGQEIPADSLAARAPTGDAVTVLTAHASKGLEWDLVCVAGVQEGVWPSSRLRGSFLGTERLVDLLRPGAESLPVEVAAVTTSTACSPRSAGCSTSP